MKARLSETLPKGTQWLYELKFDGVRALGIRDGNDIQLLSRAAKDLSFKYPEIPDALRKLKTKKFVLDGEVVALDEQGRSSFQLLQNYGTTFGPSRPPLFYYVFDVLNVEGKNVTRLPLLERKQFLAEIIGNSSPALRLSGSINAASEKLISELKARGLEGLIAKRVDSNYEIGQRSGAWLKYKWTNEQEFVIGGYTEPQGTRPFFGAILVGYYEGERLIFAAKVGTGFDYKWLEKLHKQFKPLQRAECPFTNLPERPPGLTRAEMRRCTWVEPQLVCQVRFAEWTRDHRLRQPAFLGLREDKRPQEVVREKR
jgi:bifunctional non-homologous end joining protein LigD